MDPIFLASAAATWALNKLLDHLKETAINALLRSKGLDKEVKPLIHALNRANLVLGGVNAGATGTAGVEIKNDKSLAAQIRLVHDQAVKLAKYLDVLEYYEIKEKIKKMKLKEGNKITSKVKSSITQLAHPKTNIKISDIQSIAATAKDLHMICDSLHDALVIQKLTELRIVTQNKSTDTRETAENFAGTKDFERDEKADILKQISASASSGQKLFVLPIVGDGGVGKTTLAQQVYSDPSLKDFNIKIWIYVSANFDEIKLAQGILEQIPGWEHKNTKNLNVLQSEMKKYLLTRRFLLVLDDMWEESQGRWDKLLAPLTCTPIKGNVILVTTRKLSVAKITNRMGAHIILKGMEKDLFWRFFKRCIFGDENYQGDKMLLDIGKDIATKLNGNPLAAKSVGTLLRRKPHMDCWRIIKDSDEWRAENEGDDIIPALRLSYNHLSYQLQLLFSCCALFPKGYKFDKDKLVRMWIALGFVMHERKKLENAGSDYFDDLVIRSFFQKDEQYFIVHDLMHDVAQEVSVLEYLSVDGSDPRKVFSSIRHIGIWTGIEPSETVEEDGIQYDNILESLEGLMLVGENDENNDMLKCLESLMLVGAYGKNFSEEFVKILAQVQYVRILRLSVSATDINADVLLSSVKRFIHLRYLELSYTYTSEEHKRPLPEAICKLYHLMILDITHWSGLNELPKGMSNLVNLRYLLVPGTGSLHSQISRVGELKLLQELNEFRVQQESGFNICQLKDLKEIKGSLSILDLQNVKDKAEASRARIKDKKHLKTLSLSWGGTNKGTAMQKEVIEGLKPHEYLAHLHVINYSGATTPSWLEAVRYLKSLQLKDCTELENLPSFEKLRFLKKLSLIGMSSLKEVKIDFNCGGASTASKSSDEEELELSEVEIAKCSALTSVRLHSCKVLTELNIKECRALSSLDGLPSSDQLVCKIEECPQLPSYVA
ncbi:putative disease resistance protein RGA3 [Brachypodium distachyon]|nr:putative disease resistance protein RGA3 [Brachypodium distachyon]|eukprot:XP_010239668.1 putative disease resistance protein RGA3 [Brachypodium distachyon]